MPLTENDIFFYPGEEMTTEDLRKYKPGGLHPIILGDVLPKPGSCVSQVDKKPRYRIAQKIGIGAFSTVWLARDLEEGRYISLKACVGTDQPCQSEEVRILEWIHCHGRGKSGYDNIIQLHDAFIIQGPNGFHQVVITEVVAPPYEMGRRQAFAANDAIRQLMTGFSFLHEEGVVHGDPHNGNFGIAIPQLQEFDEKTIADFFSDPPITPVVPRDPEFPRDSIPPYIAEVVGIGDFLEERSSFPPNETMVFKILDFGRAYLAKEGIPPLHGGVPLAVRPPEVFLNDLSSGKVGSVWSLSADIWSIGCLFCGIKGFSIGTTQGDSSYQLYHAMRFGGPPLAEWSATWNLNKYIEGRPNLPPFDRNEAWKRHKLRDGPREECFYDMVMKMVVTDPEKRTQLRHLLDHSFFPKGSTVSK